MEAWGAGVPQGQPGPVSVEDPGWEPLSPLDHLSVGFLKAICPGPRGCPARTGEGAGCRAGCTPGSQGWAEDKAAPSEGECFRRREARPRGLIQGRGPCLLPV